MSEGSATASASGFFSNVGYEWKWPFGLGLELGAGIAYLGDIQATNGSTTINSPGGVNFNIEAGLRYFFL
jgi:hypothetical protein